MKVLNTYLIILFAITASLILSSPSYAEEKAASEEMRDDLGIATGRVVLQDGTPMTKGFAFFFTTKNYQPHDYGSTRRLPATTAPIKQDGSFETSLFQQHTGMGINTIESGLQQAESKGLLERDLTHIKPTKRGLRFLNELQAIFL